MLRTARSQFDPDRSASTRTMSSRRVNLVICSALFLMYGLVAEYLSQACKRDPTSLFFNPNTAYQAKYSRTRKRTAGGPTVLCVGIPSIMRNNSQYLHYTIGSLFDGLSDNERQEIIFLVLIANTVPRVHYAYEQQWLKQVMDIVFEYNETLPGYDHLAALEASQDAAAIVPASFEQAYSAFLSALPIGIYIDLRSLALPILSSIQRPTIASTSSLANKAANGQDRCRGWASIA